MLDDLFHIQFHDILFRDLFTLKPSSNFTKIFRPHDFMYINDFTYKIIPDFLKTGLLNMRFYPKEAIAF